MANRASGALKLPKPVRNSGERLSINATTPATRVSSGPSRIPVPSRASSLIAAAIVQSSRPTGLRRPGSTAANPQTVATPVKPLPTPPTDDSSSKTTSPLGNPEELHTRGVEVKGHPVGSLNIPTLVEGTDGIKSQHASPIKNDPSVRDISPAKDISPIKTLSPVKDVPQVKSVLQAKEMSQVKNVMKAKAMSQAKTEIRKLPTAAEVILGLDESPPATPTKERSWPQRLSSRPSRASLLPKPVSRLQQSSASLPKAAAFHVADNGSPVAQTEAIGSRVRTLRKAVSKRFSESALGRLAGNNRVTDTRNERDDIDFNAETAYEKYITGTSEQQAADRREAVANLKAAAERAKLMYSDTDSPEQKFDAQMSILNISLMYEAARMMAHVDLSCEQVLNAAKQVTLMRRMMAIQYREIVRRFEEKEKSMMKRFTNKIPRLKKKQN